MLDSYDMALQHYQAGRLREAEHVCRQILGYQPRHGDALHLLGVIAHQAGRNNAAVNLIRQAAAIKPADAAVQIDYGNALRGLGRTDEALGVYRQALALKPDYAEAYNNIGIALQSKGLLDEAVAAFHQALAIKPSFPAALNNLGSALIDQRKLDEAIAACRQAILLQPNFPEAHNNLGNALRDSGRLDEAIAIFQRAIALNHMYAQPYSNLGNTLANAGRVDEAVAEHRIAVEIEPGIPEFHSNLIYTMYHHPGYDAPAIAQEIHRWSLRHAHPLESLAPPHTNDRDPDRRLRIGYVSADFKAHASAHFLMPLLAHHDLREVEVYCYAQVLRPDEITRRMQQYAPEWRSTVALSDAAVAEQIRRDRIDILVDLKLHTGDNRLLVFARKPAPVQVTWLGYPGSTGLNAIDYRLSDPYLDPPGTDESVYSERTIRLPETFWCYDPLDARDVPVNALPALDSRVFTFGSLNNFRKVNEGVLDLWGQVLKHVEGSRLLLLAPEGGVRQRVAERISRQGIDPARVEFVSRQSRGEYLKQYHRIDLGLDCFPVNGHTTSLDSFWMGVPVITLIGQTAMGRAGLCQLSNLGLSDLVGQTPNEFVRIAVDLARDLPRLKELRTMLRRRMEASPLMDAPKFARNMEAAYRLIWQKWCAAHGS